MAYFFYTPCIRDALDIISAAGYAGQIEITSIPGVRLDIRGISVWMSNLSPIGALIYNNSEQNIGSAIYTSSTHYLQVQLRDFRFI